MGNAYQSWHCGNDDCDGAELDEQGSGTLWCPSCERKYLSDGSLIRDDNDEDEG